MIKTIEDCKQNITNFANEIGATAIFNGEVGFGRECVGILNKENKNYLAFNPTDRVDYEFIPEYYDERLYAIAPQDAYHKYDCLSVLGTDEDSIRQLDKWCDDLRQLEVSIVKYKNGETGLQAMISGEYTYTLVPKNQLPFEPKVNE
jgi:hypothetical protein